MKRNAFTSFVTDNGNKTIPLPPYSRLFITFWGFLQWQKYTFCYEKRFSNVTMFIFSAPFMSK